MAAVIICNGEVRDYGYYKKHLDEAELVVCADGGAMHARKMGIKPDVLMGDFDSISQEVLDYFIEMGSEIVRFPTEKDMTDTEIALEFAIEKGYKRVVIIGGIGSRMDHSMANIFMLRSMLSRGVTGIIANENNEITLVNDRIELEREENVKVTLLPLSDKVEGVTTKGLYYPLDNATIEMGSSWGVSNEFVEDRAEVAVKSGLMLVIKSRD